MERSDFTNVFIALCNMSTEDDTECHSCGMHCFLFLLSIKHLGLTENNEDNGNHQL